MKIELFLVAVLTVKAGLAFGCGPDVAQVNSPIQARLAKHFQQVADAKKQTGASAKLDRILEILELWRDLRGHDSETVAQIALGSHLVNTAELKELQTQSLPPLLTDQLAILERTFELYPQLGIVIGKIVLIAAEPGDRSCALLFKAMRSQAAEIGQSYQADPKFTAFAEKDIELRRLGEGSVAAVAENRGGGDVSVETRDEALESADDEAFEQALEARRRLN